MTHWVVVGPELLSAVGRGVFIALGSPWGLGQGARDRLCPDDLNMFFLQEYSPCCLSVPCAGDFSLFLLGWHWDAL